MPLSILSLIKLSPEQIAEIRDVALDADVICASRSDPAFAQHLASADVVLGSLKIAKRDEAPKLKWIQLPHAGAEGWIDSPREIAITTGVGIYGIPIAEHVFAMMLSFTRGINDSIRAMPQAIWRQHTHSLELNGAICAMIGLGDIGRQVARRAHAFGMRVIAVKRTPGDKPSYVDELHAIDALDSVLSRADHVVLSLPGTPHTRHLINADRLRQMKLSAFIYNVGRGIVIYEPALIDALRAGRLAGAGLDVFEKEPLPPESPLWRMPNVIITPHRSGTSARRDERLVALFLDNLRRYVKGEDLRNRFRPEWGY